MLMLTLMRAIDDLPVDTSGGPVAWAKMVITNSCCTGKLLLLLLSLEASSPGPNPT